MLSKRKCVGNRLFGATVLFAFCCGFITVYAEGVLCFVFGAVACIMLVMAAFTPCYYTFDRDGVTICYLFLPKERYRWENITAIEVDYDVNGGVFDLWDLFFGVAFRLHGAGEGKRRFYMHGYIQRSRCTKRLLETYWDGTITGYFTEDIKAAIARWRAHRRRKD